VPRGQRGGRAQGGGTGARTVPVPPFFSVLGRELLDAVSLISTRSLALWGATYLVGCLGGCEGGVWEGRGRGVKGTEGGAPLEK